MVKAAFFGDKILKIDAVYGNGRKNQIAQIVDLYPEIISSDNFDLHSKKLSQLEVIFSTWGMPVLNMNQLIKLPKLKAVFYAAGSVKAFAVPFLKQHITIVSAWATNAVPVAEFTVAQILLSNKGYFRNIRDCATPEGRLNAFIGNGNNDTTVALLGAGMIGRKVIEFLKPFRLKVVVFDPFLSDKQADLLGVEKVSLENAFNRGMVVSNHLANVQQTKGILQAQHFRSMLRNSVFINTGRGATVIENQLIDVLSQRTDITALLDVSDPEPPSVDSKFYRLPNVILSSHLAGSIGREVTTMADTIIEEFIAWKVKKPLRYAVTPDMIEKMA